MFRIVRWLQSGEMYFDQVIADALWVPIAVVFVAFLCYVGYTVTRDVAIVDEQDAVMAIVSKQALLTGGSLATIYPATTIGDPQNAIAGTTNCNAAGWCSEKVIYTRATDGDHYQGWETLSPSGKRPAQILTFSIDANGFSSSGAPVDAATITSRTVLGSASDFLQYASVPAGDIASDARNPVAPVVAAYEQALGDTDPTSRQIAWGPPLAIGSNNLELDKVSVQGLTLTTGMAIGSLPPTNLTIATSFFSPSPPPVPVPVPAGTLVYEWPALAAGPNHFQVDAPTYYDVYFAEATSCVTTDPLYTPGSSPVYIPGLPPTGDFGALGPWVYPAPDPFSATSPLPTATAGPATFDVTAVAAGTCSIPVYTTYQNRATADAQALSYPVQVMGWLTLTYGGASTTSSPGPPSSPTSSLALPATALTKGATPAIAISKIYDSVPLSMSIKSNACSSYVSAAIATGSTPSTPSATPATATLNLTVSSLPAAATACAITLENQYGELVSTTLNLPAGAVAMDTWPEEIELGTSGATVSFLPHLDAGSRFAMVLNDALGGSVARAATAGCYAYALTSGGAADAAPSQATALGIYTDANGCFTNSGGTPLTEGAVVAWEPGGTSASYNLVPTTTCTSANITQGSWDPSDAGVQVALPLTGGSTAGTCAIGLSNGGSATPTIDHGLADVNVVAAMCTSGSTLPLGDSCTFDGSTPGSCDFAGGGGGVDGGPAVEIEATGPETSSGSPFGAFTVTRTGAGTITVTEQGIEYRAVLVNPSTGTYACDLEDTSSSTVITLN